MAEIAEGELEIRLRAFCEHVDSLVERSGEGGYQFDTSDEFVRAVGGNFVFGQQYLLPEHLSYHQLSRPALIEMAKYLSDAVVNPSAAIVTTLDHFRYWAWTAAIADRAFRDNEEEDVTLLKSDFQNTVHLGLLPIRTATTSGNPTLDAIHMDSERLALISGLSVLEGFICHIGNALTSEGRARKTIQASWKPRKEDGTQRTIGNGSEVSNYHDILQIWMNYDADEEVSRVLSEINNMTRYDGGVLEWKFDDALDMIQGERDDGTQNFLTILSKHRNLNLHGQTSTHALAPLALTLCCLFVLDSMSDEKYSELSEDVIESIQWRNQTPVEHVHPLWPSAFYPI